MFDYLTYNNILNLLRVLLDIGCIWIVIYYCLKIIKNNTRTIQIFKGIIFIIIIRSIATIFGLKTLEWLAGMFINWGPLALIIIFQPEIRSILEKMGKSNLFSRISTLTVNEREHLVNELVKTCGELSASKTGALISIEQGISLSDFIKTGTAMNSAVSSELLGSIFVPGTPLHDGAVIIQGDKIACASAYFPPTSLDFPSSYGARHRAAIGISEISDCVTIVVSEETGNISIAEEGKLTILDKEALKDYLLMVVCHAQNEVVDIKTNVISQTNEQETIQEDNKEPASAENNGIAGFFKKKAKGISDGRTTRKKFKKEKKTKDNKKDKENEEENVENKKELKNNNLVEKAKNEKNILVDEKISTEFVDNFEVSENDSNEDVIVTYQASKKKKIEKTPTKTKLSKKEGGNKDEK
ncbi:MAG: diadenylate cyclase CdaA [Erysipelotrichaceae bacterium]